MTEPTARQALCRVLTRHIARLDKSKRQSKATRAYREFLLRVRAILLTLSPHHSAPSWTHTRRLLILIDPVSAGLWPHLRRRRGLTLMQQFARWIAVCANPEAKPAVSLTDWRRIFRVFGSGRRIYDHETRTTPLIEQYQLRTVARRSLITSRAHRKTREARQSEQHSR